MGLRVLLVGLVASLGLEMPSGEQLSGWSDAGRGWVNARLADLTNLRDEADRSLAATTDCEQIKDVVVADVEKPGPVADTSSDGVGQKMATNFADDLEALRAEALATPGPVPTPAPVIVTMPEPTLVVAPEPTPVVSPAMVVVVEVDPQPEVTCGEPDVVSIETIVRSDVETTPASTMTNRFSSAVRLTVEAAQAWASVIQDDSSEPTH